MHIDLSGKTAIITGSTAGIGLAAAKGLAASGANVIVNGRTQARASIRLSRPSQAAVPGAKVVGFAADLGDATRLRAPWLRRTKPAISSSTISEFTREQDFFADSRQRMDAFFRSECHVRRAPVARLSAGNDRTGLGPRRFRILGIGAEHSTPTMIHYGFTKTAQLSIARGLAKRAAGTGVTVNSVLPGPTLTGGRGGYVQGESGGRAIARGCRRGLRQGTPSVVDHSAGGERRGSRQYDRLCLLAAGLRHHRRGPSRRRRRR